MKSDINISCTFVPFILNNVIINNNEKISNVKFARSPFMGL